MLKAAEGLPLSLCQGLQQRSVPLAAQAPAGGGPTTHLASSKWVWKTADAASQVDLGWSPPSAWTGEGNPGGGPGGPAQAATLPTSSA